MEMETFSFVPIVTDVVRLLCFFYHYSGERRNIYLRIDFSSKLVCELGRIHCIFNCSTLKEMQYFCSDNNTVGKWLQDIVSSSQDSDLFWKYRYIIQSISNLLFSFQWFPLYDTHCLCESHQLYRSVRLRLI